MSRLTRNQDKFWGKDNYKGNKYIIGADGKTSKQMVIDKLGKLEDLEEKLDADLIEFLSELIYVLKHSNHTTGYTSKGKEIKTDFGYVEEFIEDLKTAIKGKSE